MDRVLAALDDDRLVRLLAARPDLAQPRPSSFAELAGRAAAWPSVHACFRTLDRTHRHVVEALCLLDHPAGVRQLAAILGPEVEPEALNAPLRRLEDLALVNIVDEETIWLVGALWQLRFPAGLGPPAETVFSNFPLEYLAGIARRLGVGRGRTRADTLRALADGLRDAKVVAEALKGAPPGAAELAAELAAGPPTIPLGNWYRAEDRSPTGWLVNRGLIAVPEWGEAVMPGEACLALRGYQLFPGFTLGRPDVATVAVPSEGVDSAAAHAGLRLIADLATILLDWESSPPKLLKSGGMGVRDVRRMAAAVGRDEDATARIIELALVAGMIGFGHAGVDQPDQVLPTRAFDEWLAAGPGDRWAAVVGAWIDSGHHLAADAVRPLAGRVGGLAPAQRHAVLAVLAELPAGQAAATAETLAAAATWAEPAVWDGSPPTPVSLVIAEAELLGLVATGSLSLAGRLAVAGELASAAQALAARAPSVVADFVVQADLTAVAAGILAPDVRTELDLLADVESTGAATVYRFSPPSLVRAFDAGRTAEQIGAWLDRHARNTVPQPLSYLVADLGRRYGGLRVGRALSYLRSDDPSLIAEVLQAKATARLGLRRLAPGVLISSVDQAKVTSALRAAGYLAAEEASDGGLVVRRPERPRATPPSRRPAGVRPPVAPPAPDADVAAIVATLRQVPLVSPRPYHAPPLDPFNDLVAAYLVDDPDELPRPVAIVKDPAGIRDLLQQAYDENWLVRIEYTNGEGRPDQVNAALVHIDRRQATVEIPEDSQLRTVAIHRIQWARVLTAAEELLIG